MRKADAMLQSMRSPSAWFGRGVLALAACVLAALTVSSICLMFALACLRSWAVVRARCSVPSVRMATRCALSET